MDYLKALYVNGRVVTGLHHGDAFSKLTEDEKNSADLMSGFWNQDSGRFLAEDRIFWTKRIILVRHSKVVDALAEDAPDPGLSSEGHWWAEAMATVLSQEIDLTAFRAFASPHRRCLETGYHVLKHSGIRLQVEPRLSEAYSPPFQQENASDLIRRAETLIESLPPCSVLFSHCNLIGKLVQLICGDAAIQNVVPLASITYIVNHKVIFFGKEHDAEVCHKGRADQWRN